MQTQPHYPKHYCGVFGIFGHPNAAELTYYGLYALQHRGQESAGIVTCHDGKILQAPRHGPRAADFQRPENFARPRRRPAIGHTRYSTTGSSSNLRNAQPLTVDCARGQIAVAHNGNLTNAAAAARRTGIARPRFSDHGGQRNHHHDARAAAMGGVANSLVQTLRRIEGAYSLVIMTEKELIGARDPHGFRPLSIGRTANGAWVLVQRDDAFDLIHAQFVRDVEPGEIVIINEKGLTSIQAFPEHRSARSAFLNTFISRGRTASSTATAFMKSARKWAASSRASTMSKPIW
jgi:amidophosphoribosyltransferase